MFTLCFDLFSWMKKVKEKKKNENTLPIHLDRYLIKKLLRTINLFEMLLNTWYYGTYAKRKEKSFKMKFKGDKTLSRMKYHLLINISMPNPLKT